MPLRADPSPAASSEKGATAVEAAITMAMFLFVVGAGIELMRLAYIALTIQIVANTAIRDETLGSCNICPGGLCSACTVAQRADAIEQKAADFAKALMVTIGEKEICIKPATGVIGCNAAGTDDDAGGPRQMIVLTISRNFSLFFGLGNFQIAARAIGKNEPFGPGVM